jgi:HAD superfamily hydrolase (TIGR01456 family)
LLPLARRFATNAAAPPLPSTPAIAFDIDGVLLRGKQLLPTAKTALRKVTRREDGGDHPTGLPHIYLTNGGGMQEAAKAAQLSALFDINIPVASIVQSHTPMQQLLPSLRDELVLTVGHSREGVRNVARAYGFKHLLIPEDIMHKYPLCVPHLTNYGVPPLKEPPITHYQDELTSIAAIMVLHDPVEYYRDLQICLDILVHKRDKPVQLFFSNPDFLFSGSHASPRLAAGAFRVCLAALYKEYTGKELPYTLFGKPYAVTYRFAEKLLEEQSVEHRCSVGFVMWCSACMLSRSVISNCSALKDSCFLLCFLHLLCVSELSPLANTCPTCTVSATILPATFVVRMLRVRIGAVCSCARG